MQTNLKEERDRIDFLTDMMWSADFLSDITDFIFQKEMPDISVRKFYSEWSQNNKLDGEVIPFNFGVLVGYMYCGILFAKENWFNLLPDVSLKDADEKFGLSGVEYICQQESDPKLSYAIRRIRNALGHGNVNVDAEMLDDYETRFEKVFFEFKDENKNRPGDIFEIKLSIKQIAMFVKSFQEIIFDYVKNKK